MGNELNLDWTKCTGTDNDTTVWHSANMGT